MLEATVVLSNLVGNVPAVMSRLPAATRPGAGATLALVSTLALVALWLAWRIP